MEKTERIKNRLKSISIVMGEENSIIYMLPDLWYSGLELQQSNILNNTKNHLGRFIGINSYYTESVTKITINLCSFKKSTRNIF